MTKLDEIETSPAPMFTATSGVKVQIMKRDFDLLIRAVRQYGRERKAYQELFEAVDNDHKQIQVHAPEVYDAYDVITATPEPEDDVLELIAFDKGS